ncbi:type IV-A pilus assembly ATPase PilB [Vibrio thalassae]|uniref:type IV-A pilus assembly ATPase PilB n=1 Tax=Vibrio thalassae TaxID=1243014 RepID=UPI000BE1C2B6|nr:type IV-A pilus assembly ATPase PilB [Vibrio thalassae]
MQSTLPSILRQTNIINEMQEAALYDLSMSSGCSVPEGIAELKYCQALDLVNLLSDLFGLPIGSLESKNYSELCQQLGLREIILQYNALPISLQDSVLTLAVSDPTPPQLENDFKFASGLNIELVLVNHQTLKAAIRKIYGENHKQWCQQDKELTSDELANLVQISDSEVEQSEDLMLDDAPVSRFIHQILSEAISKKASDIHFEPYENQYRIRFRCDGILLEAHQPASQLSRRLSARLKILAKLDIAERRLPQDGRIKLKLSPQIATDIRVSTLPTVWGEKIVLRLLDMASANLSIDQLGYSQAQQSLYLQALHKPQGMILITGPTGSGKTVSLYAGLNLLNTPERNISTAEDPVEIHIDGINQVQVNPKIGFDFSQALRTFLRQDPDIVMVGEIRDIDTAEIAVKAAQTGHLVLSTLHTNSALETITRLQNMGIESHNLVSSLSLIIAQRLARCLCPLCKQPDNLSYDLRQKLNIPLEKTIYKANELGCTECNQGYSGRIGIYEILVFSPQLSTAVLQQASLQELQVIAMSQQMMTLRQSGIEKLSLGVTSYQELQRVLYFE